MDSVSRCPNNDTLRPVALDLLADATNSLASDILTYRRTAG